MYSLVAYFSFTEFRIFHNHKCTDLNCLYLCTSHTPVFFCSDVGKVRDVVFQQIDKIYLKTKYR